LLWFADPSLPAADLSADLAIRKELQESVLRALADRLNVSVDELKKDPALMERLQGADSLDTVELVMEIEDNSKP
jgi:acyl carrier protein